MQGTVTTGAAAIGKSRSETTRMNYSLGARLRGGKDRDYAACFTFLIRMAVAYSG